MVTALAFHLSDRHAAVIEGLAGHLTQKEIAHKLSISRSTVNNYIAEIKADFGVYTKQQIIARYREFRPDYRPEVDWTNSPTTFCQVSESAFFQAQSVEVDPGLLEFADAGMFPSREWETFEDHRIVPRWLDGENYRLARFGVITGLLIVVVALPILAISMLISLSQVVH